MRFVPLHFSPTLFVPFLVIRHSLALPALAIAVIAALVWLRGPDKLVISCAHDSIYAESVLGDFENRTGISVAIRFDTEATKSLGLVELLVHEKDSPRCDVFWNNELPGTLDLQERGILAPYSGPGYARIPAAFKDASGHWAGFAARLREPLGVSPCRLHDFARPRSVGGDLKRKSTNPSKGFSHPLQCHRRFTPQPAASFTFVFTFVGSPLRSARNGPHPSPLSVVLPTRFASPPVPCSLPVHAHQWGAAKAKRVLAALLRNGWSIKSASPVARTAFWHALTHKTPTDIQRS